MAKKAYDQGGHRLPDYQPNVRGMPKDPSVVQSALQAGALGTGAVAGVSSYNAFKNKGLVYDELKNRATRHMDPSKIDYGKMQEGIKGRMANLHRSFSDMVDAHKGNVRAAGNQMAQKGNLGKNYSGYLKNSRRAGLAGLAALGLYGASKLF